MTPLAPNKAVGGPGRPPAGDRGFDLTFIEVMPMGEIGAGERLDQYMPLSMVRAKLREQWTLTDLPDQTGGPARYMRVEETGGRLGFITPMTHNFCESCNRVRLTCTGTLFMCLGQDDAADLREPLRRSEGDEALEQAADHAQATGRPLLVATHHPLMPVGCAWLDEIGAENAQVALQRLAPVGKKVVVISGHVHQDAAQTYNGVQCLTAPSTCIQFAPNSADFRVDAQAPGCRMLTLNESGAWETTVLRVTDETFAVDLNSPGYA